MEHEGNTALTCFGADWHQMCSRPVSEVSLASQKPLPRPQPGRLPLPIWMLIWIPRNSLFTGHYQQLFMQASTPWLSSGHHCLPALPDPREHSSIADPLQTSGLERWRQWEGWAVKLMASCESTCLEMWTAGGETIFSVTTSDACLFWMWAAQRYSNTFSVFMSDCLENNLEVNDKIYTSLRLWLIDSSLVSLFVKEVLHFLCNLEEKKSKPTSFGWKSLSSMDTVAIYIFITL